MAAASKAARGHTLAGSNPALTAKEGAHPAVHRALKARGGHGRGGRHLRLPL